MLNIQYVFQSRENSIICNVHQQLDVVERKKYTCIDVDAQKKKNFFKFNFKNLSNGEEILFSFVDNEKCSEFSVIAYLIYTLCHGIRMDDEEKKMCRVEYTTIYVIILKLHTSLYT